MNSSQKLNSILWLVAILVLASCKTKVTNTPINEDMKSHFFYKAGSYWVYYDSLSGSTDSFVVTGFTAKNVQKDEQNTYDQIDVHISGYNIASQQKVKGFTWRLLGNHIEYYDSILPTHPLLMFVKWPIIDGDNPGNNNFTLIVEGATQISTGRVNENCWRLHHIFQDSIYQANDTFYLNESIGILKFKTHYPRRMKENSTLLRASDIDHYPTF